MKHFLRKKSFQGGGKKKSSPSPKPSLLNPPKLGGYQSLQSFSIGESIDLISDGPIEGLVNQNGQKLTNANILQGIYLDGTPIESTTPIQQISNTLGSKNYYEKMYGWGTRYFDWENGLFKTGNQIIPNSLKTNTGSGNSISYAPFSGELELILAGAKATKRVNSDYVTYIQSENLSPVQRTPISSLIPPNYPDNTYLPISIWPTYKMYGELQVPKLFFGELDTSQVIQSVDVNSANGLNDLKDSIDQINNKLLDTSISTYEKLFLTQNKNKIASLISKIESGTDLNANNYGYLCIKIDESQVWTSAIGQTIFKKNPNTGEETAEIDNFYFELSGFIGSSIDFLITPKVNAYGVFTGYFYGCIIIQFKITTTREWIPKIPNPLTDNDYDTLWIWYIDENIRYLANPSLFLNFKREIGGYSSVGISKYNFNNLSAIFKNGEEFQEPLVGFENTYIDYTYQTPLTGPFNLGVPLQRIGPIGNSNVTNPPLYGRIGGSVDIRGQRDFGAWNDINCLNEDPIPFTHTIENPNVNQVFFTLNVDSLADTVDLDEGTNESDRKIGEKRPATVTIEVQVGVTRENIITTTLIKQYTIIALVEGSMLIDFGCPDLIDKGQFYNAVRDTTGGGNVTSNLGIPFSLPGITETDDLTKVKRFIKIYKLSGETNSTLITKSIAVEKVTEIINNQFSYPFSAIVGTKFDSRSFSSAPNKTYDCRLKKIKIPSNYYPLDENNGSVDKRYISKASTYNNNNSIYYGDWDGTFKIGWTDNPAWIIYDILTSKRYGLGNYLSESEINKWELYKIARFCDSVDENGYFIGVSDGFGGLEPRFSFNGIFKEPSKIYDSITTIANLFRGSIYFNNSEIHFVDDRPRTPIMTFSNTNVKDGLFNYTNIRKDQQFNSIEVTYLDRFDNFKNKIEYIEDEGDIRKRGVLKTKIETFGVTSKAMARRIGQHMIYQTTKENQAIEFVAGLESLLCRPGDLIIIEDDLKTRSENFGRILEININQKSLLLENQYLPDKYNGVITAYTPTGYLTLLELNDLNTVKRSELLNQMNTMTNTQITNFYITGYDNTLEYGSRVYLDKTKSNINLVSNLKAGSPYRIGRQNAYDQIYKVLAIKEENQNEYIVVGAKYNTGKFNEIENFTSEDFLSDTYYSGPSKVGNININQLQSPFITIFGTGLSTSNNFTITGRWNPVSGASKYKYKLYNQLLTGVIEQETSNTFFDIKNLKQIGFWELEVYSLAQGIGQISSTPSKTGTFVSYQSVSEFNILQKPAISKFQII